MSIKASISVFESKDAFASGQVDDCPETCLNNAVPRGGDLVRDETERKEAELAALRTLIEDRARGPFLSVDEARQQTEDLITAKKTKHGL
ncbi:MAG: type II toxin-antitoxin system ParD family antitoxin [Pseudomonadota bacterium]